MTIFRFPKTSAALAAGPSKSLGNKLPAQQPRDGSSSARDSSVESVVARLEVVRLDRTSWRICDPSIEEHTASRLLGYIERLESSRYEVLWLAPPVGWAYVATFDLALAAIADREQFDGAVGSQRDPSVLTSTPSPFHRGRRRTDAAQSGA